MADPAPASPETLFPWLSPCICHYAHRGRHVVFVQCATRNARNDPSGTQWSQVDLQVDFFCTRIGSRIVHLTRPLLFLLLVVLLLILFIIYYLLFQDDYACDFR